MYISRNDTMCIYHWYPYIIPSCLGLSFPHLARPEKQRSGLGSAPATWDLWWFPWWNPSEKNLGKWWNPGKTRGKTVTWGWFHGDLMVNWIELGKLWWMVLHMVVSMVISWDLTNKYGDIVRYPPVSSGWELPYKWGSIAGTDHLQLQCAATVWTEKMLVLHILENVSLRILVVPYFYWKWWWLAHCQQSVCVGMPDV